MLQPVFGPSVTTDTLADVPEGRASRVIVASRRAPLEPVRRHGQVRWVPGPDGLVQAVAPALVHRDSWVAFRSEGARAPSPPDGAVPYSLRLVQLDRRARRLYQTACDRVLRPALHGIEPPGAIAFHDLMEAWSQGYVRANAQMARALAREWERDPAPVLLQDYELAGCAPLLRELIPDVQIGLFCHSPFLGPDAMGLVPVFMGDGLLRGLLACDLIGFQSHRDLSGFAQACSQLLGTYVRGDLIQWGPRNVRLGVFPAGVDPEGLAEDAAEAADQALNLPDEDKVVAWVGSSDPVMNAVGAVEAVHRLLLDQPELRGRLRLLLIVLPVHQDLPEYRDYLVMLHQAAARVNAQLATDGWVPVALDTSTDAHRALAALRRADVVFMNPLADGLNVVVQQAAFVSRQHAAIALSRTAAAFERLSDVVVAVDPSSSRSGAAAIGRALRLSQEDRTDRLEVIRHRSARWTSSRWFEAQLQVLGHSRGMPAQGTCRTPTHSAARG